MIDWVARVAEINRMADELDLWATRTGGRGRLVLGRMADELRLFALEVARALVEPEQTSGEPLPEWLAQEVLLPETEGAPVADQEFLPQLNDQEETSSEEWQSDQQVWDEGDETSG